MNKRFTRRTALCLATATLAALSMAAHAQSTWPS